MYEIKRCFGEGLGSCVRCSSLGRWNRTWMSFLYYFDGVDGCFCYDCAKIVSHAKSLGQDFDLKK